MHTALLTILTTGTAETSEHIYATATVILETNKAACRESGKVGWKQQQQKQRSPEGCYSLPLFGCQVQKIYSNYI